jgi:hypothetical protein
MVVYGDGNLVLSSQHAVCAMKTCYQTRPFGMDGYFYVPNATTNALKVENWFTDPYAVGDPTGNSTPYPQIAHYPDGSVDMTDVRFEAKLFGKNEGQPGWEYMADVIPDRTIDMKDIRTAAKNFGFNTVYEDFFTDPNYLNGIALKFNTHQGIVGPVYPDDSGFLQIPQGATDFNVTRFGNAVRAMIIFVNVGS